jgi:hypothetical protein
MAGRIRGKKNQRTVDRIHLLVRLEKANPMLSLGEVARLAGVKPNHYAIIRASPLYQHVNNQYTTGLLTDIDKQARQNFNLSQETLNFAVPVALQTLVQQAMASKDERVKNKACNDLLDRHGHFAKVTRHGLATTEQGGAAGVGDDEAAAALLKAMSQETKVATNNPSTEQESGDTSPSLSDLAPPNDLIV